MKAEMTSTRPIRVFYSYSHADTKYLEELQKHTAPLVQQGRFIEWVDRYTPAGDPLEGNIRRELGRADLIVFLVSSHFLASKFIQDIEVPMALSRRKQGVSRIVPVIVRACVWESEKYRGLKALPTDGKPIQEHKSRDKAYVDVVKGLMECCTEPVPQPPPQPLPKPPPQPPEPSVPLPKSKGHGSRPLGYGALGLAILLALWGIIGRPPQPRPTGEQTWEELTDSIRSHSRIHISAKRSRWEYGSVVGKDTVNRQTINYTIQAYEDSEPIFHQVFGTTSDTIQAVTSAPVSTVYRLQTNQTQPNDVAFKSFALDIDLSAFATKLPLDFSVTSTASGIVDNRYVVATTLYRIDTLVSELVFPLGRTPTNIRFERHVYGSTLIQHPVRVDKSDTTWRIENGQQKLAWTILQPSQDSAYRISWDWKPSITHRQRSDLIKKQNPSRPSRFEDPNLVVPCRWVPGSWSDWSSCVGGRQTRIRSYIASVPECTPHAPRPPDDTMSQLCHTSTP